MIADMPIQPPRTSTLMSRAMVKSESSFKAYADIHRENLTEAEGRRLAEGRLLTLISVQKVHNVLWVIYLSLTYLQRNAALDPFLIRMVGFFQKM